MTDKKTYEKFVTPRGVFLYPHLIRPDTKFDEDGVYRVTIAVDPEEAAGLIDQLTTARDAFLEELDPAKAKKARVADVVEEELDDEGEPTGRVLIKAKQKAVIRSGDKVYTKKVSLFDAKNAKITPESMWSGTEGKLAGVLIPYYMASTKEVGVSLRLSGVQVLKLVEGSGDSGESFGFGEEEGYEGETFENTSSNAGGEDTDGDGGEF